VGPAPPPPKTPHLPLFIERFRISDVQELQKNLLQAQLVGTSILSIGIYALAIIPALQNELIFVVFLYSFFFAWLILITLFKRLSYGFRAGSWLFFLFFFGIVNLAFSGLNVDAGMLFLTFVIMTSLLLGLRFGLISLGLSSLAILIAGVYVVNQHVDFKIGLPQTNPLLWEIGGGIFLLVGSLSAISVASLMSGLMKNLAKSKQLAQDLSQAHETLAGSEIRFRSLIEYSSDLVAILREDGQVSYVSPSIQRLLGYQPDEMEGKIVLDFIHPQDQIVVLAALTPGVPAELIGDLVEVRIRHKDGSYRTFEVNGYELKNTAMVNGTVVNCRDITDRKNMEHLLQIANENLEQQVIARTAELQTASARLNELVTRSPAVIYSTPLIADFNFVQTSSNIDQLLGFSAYQVQSEFGFWPNHIHPADASRVVAHKGQIEIEKKVSCKYRLLHSNGHYVWIRDDMQLVQAADGCPLELVGSWIDISRQVEAEQATFKSENSYRRLYETMMDAFVRVEMDGRIIEFNQAYQDMLGYTTQELYQLTYVDITPEKWHAMEAELVQKQILPLGFSEVYEKEYIRKDGSIFSVDLRTGLTRDEAGNPESMWAIVRDITQRKLDEATIKNARDELEKRVVERTLELSASQERLQQLTREIITAQEEERRSVSRELHDEAGQVFVTLKHNLDIALDELPEGNDPLRTRLESAMELVDRSMFLVRSLSHRLRPAALEVGGIHISLEDLCRDIADQTRLSIQYTGQDLPGLPNEIAISLYRVVQEALTNILKHADARRVQVRLHARHDFVMVSVRDDGKGVLASTRAGTGLLGLQERLHLLGGEIKIEFQPGKGVHLLASIPWHRTSS
jgi:PAS domain S-box-containing protein